MKAGIDYFNRAIEADPQYALAYVGLADSYNILGSWAFTAVPVVEARKMALLHANKALAIDDRLGEAHTSLANAKVLFDWDWEGGEAEFRRAIELNPNYANAYHWYAELLLNLGRFDECIRQSYKAKELDPLAPMITSALAERLVYAGRAEPAIKEATIALELDPNLPLTHAALANAYAQQGRISEAIAEFEKAVHFSNSNPNFIADMGYAYAVAGDRERAGGILNRLKEMSRTRYVPPYQLAAVYAGLGQNRKALKELERAYSERSPWMINLRVDPRFEHLRAEPEFVRLLKALQFPDS
jgi:tetratricopeptide (TPR) repeat protein